LKKKKKKDSKKQLAYCQSLNQPQPEGSPKMTHHLHVETRLPSGIRLNETIPKEQKHFQM
jgi:hypothetical protein